MYVENTIPYKLTAIKYLDILDILNLCDSDIQLKKAICDNSDVWSLLLKRDFGLQFTGYDAKNKYINIILLNISNTALKVARIMKETYNTKNIDTMYDISFASLGTSPSRNYVTVENFRIGRELFDNMNTLYNLNLQPNLSSLIIIMRILNDQL